MFNNIKKRNMKNDYVKNIRDGKTFRRTKKGVLMTKQKQLENTVVVTSIISNRSFELANDLKVWALDENFYY